MSVASLNCPTCGAPAAPEATECAHCGSRLATVGCPACFALVFRGAKFCSHCGAPIPEKPNHENAAQRCPKCRLAMEQVLVGGTPLMECRRCAGLWVGATALERLCADKEKQAAVLGIPGGEDAKVTIEKVRYLPCPECKQLMNRINFARFSNVIVDVCRQHGTWFDRDELRRVIEFIRDGGVDRARLREREELEARKRQLAAAELRAGSMQMEAPKSNASTDGAGAVLSAILTLLRDL